MRLELDHRQVFAATGGRAHEPKQTLILFLHGAGMDHSVWALQSRWFAYHGANVLAVDLPGHGGSAGPALTDIGALADWTARLIGAVGAARAALVGHSMGALIALETAARHPELVAGMALIGAAAKMPVHPDLIAAAKENSHVAIDMVSLWGLGASAALGGNNAPGLWMLGGTERLLEKAAPGVLHADLAACNAYQTGAEFGGESNLRDDIDPGRTRPHDAVESGTGLGGARRGGAGDRAAGRRTYADDRAAGRSAGNSQGVGRAFLTAQRRPDANPIPLLGGKVSNRRRNLTGQPRWAFRALAGRMGFAAVCVSRFEAGALSATTYGFT